MLNKIKILIFFLFVISLIILPNNITKASIDTPTNYDTLIKGSETIDGESYEPRFSEAVKCSNGDILVFYYWNSVHVGTQKGIIQMARSTDNGLTWSTPVTVVDLKNENLDARDPGCTLLSNGDIALTYFTYREEDSVKRKNVYFKKSSDNGLTWSTPVVVATGASTTGAPVELDNGDLLMPVYNLSAEGCVVRSSNNGASWGTPVVVNPGPCDEAYLAYAGNDTIYMFSRPYGWIYESKDNGVSWTGNDMARIQHLAPHVLKLADDKFFVTWCRYGVDNNRIVEGKVFIPSQGWWSTETKMIYNSNKPDVWDMGYPSTVLTNDGKLLTIYYDAYRKICAGTFTDLEDDWESTPPVYNLDTYEDVNTGNVPAGYVQTSGSSAVSTSVAYSGSKSLRIFDNSSSVITNVSRTTKADKTIAFEFKIYPETLTNGFYVSLGSGGNSNSNMVFHIKVNSSGNLSWYNGSSYTDLSGASLNLKQWNTVKIEAMNMNNAIVTVNGTVSGLAGKWNIFDTIDRIRFTSYSTTGIGDDIFIDDLQRIEYVTTFERDTVGNVPANFAEVESSSVVSNDQAYEGSKSLRVYDSSSSLLSSVVKVSDASTSKMLEFKLKPVSLTNGMYVSFGSGGNNNSDMVFHFRISNTGVISWYNGSTYTVLSGAVVNLNEWNTIKMYAFDTEYASIIVNGKVAGYAGYWNEKTTIDRVRFTSHSTTGVGDDFYIDNLIFCNKYE